MADESLGELIDEFVELKDIRRFEGDKGVENLNKLTKAIGYPGHNYRYGSSLESFLADNSGAIEALVNWIGEQNITEWKESLESELPERDQTTIEREEDEQDY